VVEICADMLTSPPYLRGYIHLNQFTVYPSDEYTERKRTILLSFCAGTEPVRLRCGGDMSGGEGGTQRTKHGQPFVQTRPAFPTNPADAAFRPFGFYLYKEGNPAGRPFLSSVLVANHHNHPFAASVWYQRGLSKRNTGSPPRVKNLVCS
jgi:hypothetical protein